MTLIECFTPSHIDNMAACLRLRPEKMILIGSLEEMNTPVKRYRALLKGRGQNTDIQLCDVRKKDFLDICAVLMPLVSEEADCVIDMTGGDEPVIMAVGAVLAGMDDQQRRKIRVQKLDHKTNTVLDCLNDNRPVPGKGATLTVPELIGLYGGALHPEATELPENCSPKSINKLWELSSRDPSVWNRSIMVMGELESRADSRMQVFLSREMLENIPNIQQKEEIARDFIGKLSRCGVVDDQSTCRSLEYSYRSPLLRYCTQKAGNVLEVKTLLEGRSVRENGVPYFQDCRMSVSIDWDGVTHEISERVPETKNEIDVVLMHGLTPLFVSCKNGNIGDEELYKLHTVATRFGGPNARKMLIATDLDRKSDMANRSFAQRARDMGIHLVPEAAKLTPEEWREEFLNALR